MDSPLPRETTSGEGEEEEEGAPLSAVADGFEATRGESESPRTQSELDPALLLERSRRVRAEQQVEAERQTCLELTRLLELEQRKVKQQARRPSTISDSVAARRRGSETGVTVSFVIGGSQSLPQLGEREREEDGEKAAGEDDRKVGSNTAVASSRERRWKNCTKISMFSLASIESVSGYATNQCSIQSLPLA